MTPDLLAWPLLEALEAALIEEIASSGLDPFCFVGIMPGQAAALDYLSNCDDQCGMAWVRLASIREEPADFNDGFSNCSSEFSVNVEMGMVRCHQTFIDSEGEPMPAEYQRAKAEAQTAEMAAMRRVLVCSAGVDSIDKLLGNYQPIGPAGGAVGGAWTCQFQRY